MMHFQKIIHSAKTSKKLPPLGFEPRTLSLSRIVTSDMRYHYAIRAAGIVEDAFACKINILNFDIRIPSDVHLAATDN